MSVLTPRLPRDAGGMIAFERAQRLVVALLARAHETDAAVTIPSTALAQAIRRPCGSASRDLRSHDLRRLDPTLEIVKV